MTSYHYWSCTLYKRGSFLAWPIVFKHSVPSKMAIWTFAGIPWKNLYLAIMISSKCLSPTSCWIPSVSIGFSCNWQNSEINKERQYSKSHENRHKWGIWGADNLKMLRLPEAQEFPATCGAATSQGGEWRRWLWTGEPPTTPQPSCCIQPGSQKFWLVEYQLLKSRITGVLL